MTAVTPRLRGYRETDRPLLTGPWLAGELLGTPPHGRPALAEPVVVPTPADDELCVVPGVAFIRYTELDWIHRRARLEIGAHTDDIGVLGELVRLAVAHGFAGLNLHRLYGWRTPAAALDAGVLGEHGFRCEAVIPQAAWLAGGPVDREIWGVVRDD